ncbi:MAG: tetratricopeptide repeat protein [Wenzhouxiangellaceae bacterium]
MALLFVPLIGAVAYLILELIPEWRGSVGGQRTMRSVKNTLDPGADTRHWAARWEQSPNAENARHYASALIESQRPKEALEVLRQAATGFFQHEPNLLQLRARAKFALEQYDDAVSTLETLIEQNPNFKSADGHLLYARALEASGQIDRALEEYRAVAGYYPGAEARYRLACALLKADQKNAGQHELESMQRDARLAPAHFRKSQKVWLRAAAEKLNSLN